MENSESGEMQVHIPTVINALVKHTNDANKHWWPEEYEKNLFVVPTKLMLIVSELAEAMEGHRKGLMDDKLPHRPMIEVELVDAMIRIWDLAGQLGLDLGGAYSEKMQYNASREDHTDEARQAEGGKKY